MTNDITRYGFADRDVGNFILRGRANEFAPTDLTADILSGYSMSSTVFREKGYRFFFFSREETRMHVHVISGNGETKLWLEPKIALARNYYYNRRQLKEIKSLIELHYDELISTWKQHFSC